jgi:hypothetical protein
VGLKSRAAGVEILETIDLVLRRICTFYLVLKEPEGSLTDAVRLESRFGPVAQLVRAHA